VALLRSALLPPPMTAIRVTFRAWMSRCFRYPPDPLRDGRTGQGLFVLREPEALARRRWCITGMFSAR